MDVKINTPLDHSTKSQVDKIQLTEPRVWKISHGGNKDILNDQHNKLIEKGYVCIHQGLQEIQRKNFLENIKTGDVFYLIRNSKIVLIGIIASEEHLDSNDLKDLDLKDLNLKDKYLRKFDLHRKLDTPFRLVRPFSKVGWMPSGNTTVFEVPEEELQNFEEKILDPAFQLKLSNLNINQGLTHKFGNNNYMTNSLNRILYGPPGTGKTYNSIIEALKIIEGEKYLNNDYENKKIRFDKLKEAEQIEFVNFHQSFSYEDFVEGIRASTNDVNQITYKVEPGIFKEIAKKAKADKDKNYVLIIDEINRGNISRIFGELITLIEPSKRLGGDEALTVKLPYSKNEDFGVPNNLYIIGTMNTADRSLALMDTALRRRFDFIEMMPQPDLIKVKDGPPIEINGIKVQEMLKVINQRIEALYDREHMIGHAFFMSLNSQSKIEDLALIFRNKILPLLEEYFFEDWEKITKVLGNSNIYTRNDWTSLGHDFTGSSYSRNNSFLNIAQTYISIYKTTTD